LKIILVVLFSLSAVSFAWFSLQIEKLIPTNFYLLLTASVLAGLFLNSSQAIFYELSVELTYPIAEGTSAAVLTFGV
jgi:FLVCR family MFS transporter